MKKALALLLACLMVCMAFTACTGGNNEANTDGNKTVYIGVYEPQSGDNGAAAAAVFAVMGGGVLVLLKKRK